MKRLVCLLVCVCVLQTALVESGVIFDKIKSGASQVKHGVKCGFHKVGNIFYEHDHENDPCRRSQETDNKIDTTTVFPDIDVRGQDGDTLTVTPKSQTDVPDSRRLIAAGSNCPPGYRSDTAGRCREEY